VEELDKAREDTLMGAMILDSMTTQLALNLNFYKG